MWDLSERAGLLFLDGERAHSFVHMSSDRRNQNDGSDNHSISDHSDRPLGAPPASPRSGAQSPRINRKRTLPLVNIFPCLDSLTFPDVVVQDYRPPTPPLPACVKEERLDGQSVILPSVNYHVVYLVLPIPVVSGTNRYIRYTLIRLLFST